MPRYFPWSERERQQEGARRYAERYVEIEANRQAAIGAGRRAAEWRLYQRTGQRPATSQPALSRRQQIIHVAERIADQLRADDNTTYAEIARSNACGEHGYILAIDDLHDAYDLALDTVYSPRAATEPA